MIISFLESNFNDIDIDVFKELLGLFDGIPKKRIELATKYGVSGQAIDQRYKKVLRKIKEKFNISE